MIKWTLILLSISAISKGICDKIQFKGLSLIKWDTKIKHENFVNWIFGRGKYSWDKRTWLTKNIFSFVSDGWHFFDAVRVMSLCVIITMFLHIYVYWAIGFYIIHGIIFELIYGIKQEI